MDKRPNSGIVTELSKDEMEALSLASRGSKEEKKSSLVNISIKVTEADRNRLKEIAKEKGCSYANIIRNWIDEYSKH